MDYKVECLCGEVEIELKAPDVICCHDCDCDYCKRTGSIHFFVKKADFKIIKGEGSLRSYFLNSTKINFNFCKICGVRPFYSDSSGSEKYGVDVNLIEPEPNELKITKRTCSQF